MFELRKLYIGQLIYLVTANMHWFIAVYQNARRTTLKSPVTPRVAKPTL